MTVFSSSSNTAGTLPFVMKRFGRKRNRVTTVTVIAITGLFLIWLYIHVNNTWVFNDWSFWGCRFRCDSETCKVCKPLSSKFKPTADIVRDLNMVEIQLQVIPQNFTPNDVWYSDKEQICKHVPFDLINDSIKHAFPRLDALNCTGTKLFYNNFRVLRINKNVLKERKLTKCLYYMINRTNYDGFTYAEPFMKDREPFDFTFKQDFIHVKCYFKKESEKKRSINILVDKNQSETHQSKEEVTGSESNVTDSTLSAERNDEKARKQSKSRRFRKSVDSEVDTVKGSDQGNGNVQNEHEEPADIEQFLTQIYPKPEVFDRISEKIKQRRTDQRYMDVLIIGLDSMSHLAFQRKMPITYKYLQHTLKSVIFHGYNIVGDGTTAALIPILTGKLEHELPEVRLHHKGAHTLDIYPFIWKRFQEAGYVTMFAEDEPDISVFNLRVSGFKEQPTDHYMKPFWQALWKTELQKSSRRLCTGYKPSHEYLVEYVKDFFDQYSNVSKFGFLFVNELTHNNNNPAEYMDKDLTNLLQYFEEKKFLDNTLLIVMGDHGARYSSVRNTAQGTMEERLPLMSLTFPEWFLKKYPNLQKNLQTNSNKISTPFDIHETLNDVLDLQRTRNSVNHRAFSLLQHIPLDRTCVSAEIPLHWCTCLKQVNLNVDGEHVLNAAQSMLNFMTKKTSELRDQCVQLKVKEVSRAQLLIPNEKISPNGDLKLANLNFNIDVDNVHFQITIATAPNDGLYESNVLVNIRTGTYKVIDDTYRIDEYGDEAICIEKMYPDLSKYCYCVEYVNESKEEPEKNNDTMNENVEGDNTNKRSIETIDEEVKEDKQKSKRDITARNLNVKQVNQKNERAEALKDASAR